MASTFLNLSTDTTLGGNSPSDSVAVSQKAIKSYVDNNSGSTYTAGTGISIASDVISVDNTVVTTNTAQDITAIKTFFGEKAIYFKQNTSSNKLGFTLYDNNNKEVGALEFRPNSIDGTPILTLNSPSPLASGTSRGNSYVGFRYWDYSLNILAPYSSSLYRKNLFIPVTFTNGTTTVESTSTNGSVDISSLLPTKTSDLTNDSGYITNTASDYANTSLTIYSQYSAQLANCVNVGENSKASATGTTSLGSLAQSFGMASTALGYGAEAYGYCAVAIGSGAEISSSITNDYTAIQIGRGTNSDPDTMYVGFGNYLGNHHNYKLLDGATGLIPSARIAIDGTSITVNSSGQLQASGGGASEVTLATVATTGAYSDLSGTPTVDQTYDGTSANAQSGVAVASAISGKADDSAVVHLAGTESITGQKTFSSVAYGTASDANGSIVTTVNKTKSGDGYFKFGNGLIIQWGSSSVSRHIANVTLPTSFTSTNYQISALRVANSSTTNESNPFYTRSKTKTTFQLYNPGSNATSVSWIAIGY